MGGSGGPDGGLTAEELGEEQVLDLPDRLSVSVVGMTTGPVPVPAVRAGLTPAVDAAKTTSASVDQAASAASPDAAGAAASGTPGL